MANNERINKIIEKVHDKIVNGEIEESVGYDIINAAVNKYNSDVVTYYEAPAPAAPMPAQPAAPVPAQGQPAPAPAAPMPAQPAAPVPAQGQPVPGQPAAPAPAQTQSKQFGPNHTIKDPIANELHERNAEIAVKQKEINDSIRAENIEHTRKMAEEKGNHERRLAEIKSGKATAESGKDIIYRAFN